MCCKTSTFLFLRFSKHHNTLCARGEHFQHDVSFWSPPI